MGELQGLVLSGPLIVAAPIALLAGSLSFFTPCSLPLVPGYLSYVAGMAGGAGSPVADELSGQHVPARRRARVVLGAVLFVTGFAVVFTAYGALFGAVGATLVRYQEVVIRVSGLVTITMGLLFAGLGQRLPLLSRTARLPGKPPAGLLGAPVLGAVFGVGWTPCIGPALAAVLVLATSSTTAGRGALLSLVYALGLGIPFVLAALSLTKAIRVFGWVRRRTRWLTIGGGIVLVLVGLAQVTGVWSEMIAALQSTIATWRPPV